MFAKRKQKFLKRRNVIFFKKNQFEHLLNQNTNRLQLLIKFTFL